MELQLGQLSALIRPRAMAKRERNRSITGMRCGIGGIARPHLRARQLPVAIDHHHLDHLPRVAEPGAIPR